MGEAKRFETLDYELDAGVAIITLARPEAHNTMDGAMVRDLMEVTLHCDEDPQVRAVILTGKGKAFCAGGDLKAFSAAGSGVRALIKEMTTYLHAANSRLAHMDAPVIAAVNGVAAGAGLSLVGNADLALAAESSRFTSAYTRAGLSPDGGSTWFLPRIIGMRRTQELILTNRTLSAAEAAEWGLVTRVVPDDDLMAEARVLARTLAEGPTRTFGRVKDLLLTTFSEPLEGQLEKEARLIAEAAASPDGQEGIWAFVEKRPPRFWDL